MFQICLIPCLLFDVWFICPGLIPDHVRFTGPISKPVVSRVWEYNLPKVQEDISVDLWIMPQGNQFIEFSVKTVTPQKDLKKLQNFLNKNGIEMKKVTMDEKQYLDMLNQVMDITATDICV